ncbi:hypothetical protein [Halalkalicoccus jeotgali]|uniref:Right handed beta helix domain-containing protein n=1 Tax=Halalkalicoccus jeotgali (strain DSM 18796 / CECT 7217 / JCM 14584 / KCTC 4019 / B3) TaxID=795797 RepID=D8J6L8_HALJB|nr:hypothetical protein [Halalkalicoccus jeotgali]ADJ13895.1 hypothetical protein HacjB3_02510 [Halalkalicoccus jeotgali B3]ELY34057.1 hypothetical protein C497_16797 [Halalkalicoccus jeotgali B3]
MPDYFTNQRIQEALHDRPIAGGTGYHADISLDDADVIVDDQDAFVSALNSTADVIGIEGHTRIDLSGRDYELADQTIISDRGDDGSPGALLYTSDRGADSPAWDGGSNGRGVITVRGNARISGVRYRGPFYDYNDNPAYPGYIPLDDGATYADRQAMRQERYARGLRLVSDEIEIDNCELYGWPVQAIAVGAASLPVSPHIHHIYGHDCMMVGAGYVIDIFNGHPRIEMSYFNATRHAISGFGHPECGYTLEDSVFGPITTSHAVDMHTLAENGDEGNLTAGDRVEVRRCTFAFTENIQGQNAQAIVFRGYPEDEYVTENNRFMHEIEGSEPVANVANEGYEPVPYRQVNVGEEWVDWTFANNQYGVGTPHEPGVGAPVNLDAPLAGKPLLDEERRRGLQIALRPLE